MDAWRWEAAEYGFRMAKRGQGGGGAWSGVSRAEFWATVREWDLEYGTHNYYIDDRVPDTKQTIQGELCRTHRGLEGYIGSSHLPMRLAMQQGILTPRSPIETLVIINSYMDPSSRDDIDAILELFPDATIEFTCFQIDIGNIPGRNTILWEVRNY
jgi:hypothetical protein